MKINQKMLDAALNDKGVTGGVPVSTNPLLQQASDAAFLLKVGFPPEVVSGILISGALLVLNNGHEDDPALGSLHRIANSLSTIASSMHREDE